LEPALASKRRLALPGQGGSQAVRRCRCGNALQRL